MIPNIEPIKLDRKLHCKLFDDIMPTIPQCNQCTGIDTFFINEPRHSGKVTNAATKYMKMENIG